MAKAKKNYTLGEFLDMVNFFDKDVDVQVDGTDCYIAVCAGVELTDEGEKYFKKALALPMDGYCVISKNNKDYDEYEEKGTGVLAKAEELLYALAGYCACSDWDKWFKNIND